MLHYRNPALCPDSKLKTALNVPLSHDQEAALNIRV